MAPKLTVEAARSLAAVRPELAAWWHSTRNGDLTPDRVTPGSNKRVWWQCPQGVDHAWQATMLSRSHHGTGCPFCKNRRVSADNSLATRYPAIAAQWHPTRNGDLLPEQVTAGTDRRAWWRCPEHADHEWEATIGQRVRLGYGCPFCAGRRVSSSNSLARRCADLAQQWHPTLNGDLTPDDVTDGSPRKVWWQCPLSPEHFWRAAINSRARRGNGCPFCSGHRILPERSLAGQYPEVARQWHPTLNGDLTPDRVGPVSPQSAWWQCPEQPDHVWSTGINNRTARGQGCPFCNGRRATATTSLAYLHPDLAAEWHPTLNGALRPDDLRPGSNRLVWWRCSAGPDHCWQALVISRALRGRGCPFCAGHRVSVTNALVSRRPDLEAEWHPSHNGKLTPSQVVAGSNRKVWWKCPAGPDHEWTEFIYNRTLLNLRCPFCSNRRVSVTNSLASRFPEIALEWHPTRNGTLAPDRVVASSGQRVWWKCPAGPDHEWEALLSSRTLQGTGCPFCAHQRVSVTNSLASLYPSVAAEWHPTRNGTLTPDNVVAGAMKRVWWKCPAGPDHEWEAVINSRTRMPNGTGCPFCANHRVSVTNSLASLYPTVATEWHPTKKGDRTPQQTLAAWEEKVWWLCGNDQSHDWKCSVYSRTVNGTLCPYCHLDDREKLDRLWRKMENAADSDRQRSGEEVLSDGAGAAPRGRRRRPRRSPECGAPVDDRLNGPARILLSG